MTTKKTNKKKKPPLVQILTAMEDVPSLFIYTAHCKNGNCGVEVSLWTGKEVLPVPTKSFARTILSKFAFEGVLSKDDAAKMMDAIMMTNIESGLTIEEQLAHSLHKHGVIF